MGNVRIDYRVREQMVCIVGGLQISEKMSDDLVLDSHPPTPPLSREIT